MIYIYKITNKINQKVYIGQTINIHRRWQAHRSYSKNPKRTAQYIHRAMFKYGIENFVFSIIDFGLTQNQADCLEVNYINQYNSKNKECGYNLAPRGGKAWNKGLPPEMQPGYGRIPSEYQRKRISETHKGSIKPLHSQEWKDNMSKIMSGRTLPPEQVEKIASGNRGKKRSEETKLKLSISHLGKKSRAKLTEDQVNEIKKLLSDSKMTNVEIAKIFNVNRVTISNIKTGHTWK